MAKPYHHGALREALLSTAETIVERAGVDGLTLRAIAQESGVSVAAPSHHFGDLSGLLSELAAVGFTRFCGLLQAEADAASSDAQKRVAGIRRAYIGFARHSPGLFLLMFRPARLDWSRPNLAVAGGRAFQILLEQGTSLETDVPYADRITEAITTWSLIHGLSMLIIDGRLGPMMEKFSGPDVETLIDSIAGASGRR